MSEIAIARENRKGLFIPLGGTRQSPNLLFPLDGIEKSELDQLIRAILAKMGVTEESEISAIIARVEADHEVRIRIYEARKEMRRLMALRRQGIKLMQNGYRKWQPVSYRPL
jgi:hypothetical protein